MSEQPEPEQQDDARPDLPAGELTWGPGNPPAVVDEFLYPERPDGVGLVRPGEEPTP